MNKEIRLSFKKWLAIFLKENGKILDLLADH